MARYQKTGILRQRTERPQYGDFSNLGDYQDALNTIVRAERLFSELNSKVRSRFENDPQQFIDFCANPDNQDEAIALGSAAPPAPEIPAEPENRPNHIIILQILCFVSSDPPG